MPNLAEARLRPYADAALITADPAYGHVVCLCERVTSGEIRDALGSPVPARDLDGIRRRTRALAGRCQGFHCGATVTAMLDERGRHA
jgi:glycerol-3-phosphate dehydrogenase